MQVLGSRVVLCAESSFGCSFCSESINSCVCVCARSISAPATAMAEASESESADSTESPDEAKKVRKIPVLVILLVELCERLTYYTLAGTQKIYLQNQLHKLPSTAAALNSVFSMLCYFWCIPGGLIADSVGRYKTIIGAGAIYATGTLCLAIAVVHAFQTSLGWMFTGGCLVLIAAGTGGIKPNIANFGADQIGDETESQRECQKTYFSLFYLAINVGVLFAFGFFTNITTGGLAGVVSQSEGYSFAYGAGAVFMIAAVLIFISFTPSYRRLPGNGLGPVKRLVRYQCRSLRGGGWRAAMSAIGWLCLPFFYIVTLAAVSGFLLRNLIQVTILGSYGKQCGGFLIMVTSS